MFNITSDYYRFNVEKRLQIVDYLKSEHKEASIRFHVVQDNESLSVVGCVELVLIPRNDPWDASSRTSSFRVPVGR